MRSGSYGCVIDGYHTVIHRLEGSEGKTTEISRGSTPIHQRMTYSDDSRRLSGMITLYIDMHKHLRRTFSPVNTSDK